MGVKTMKKVAVKKSGSAAKTKMATSSSLLRGKSTPKAKKTASGRADRIERAILSMTASIAETSAKTEAKIAETSAKTEAKIAETNAKTEAKIAETDAKLEASAAETRAKVREAIAAMEKTTQNLFISVQNMSISVEKITADLAKSVGESIKNLGGNVGDVNNRLGEIVEMMVLSGLMEKMNAEYGYQFDNVSSDRIFKNNGQQYAEADLFLENGDSVMVVEAKARVKEGDVNKLVTTLQKLRAHEVKAGLVGKTIYGAIAGIVFDVNARRAAEDNGLYLVDIDQNNDRIKIELPGGTAGRW